MGVSNMTLVKIASIGGFATITMGFALRFKLNNNIKEADFCKEALKTVRSHKAAVHLLGEPIKDHLIEVGDQEKNYAKDNLGQYEIPLKGPKQKGTLFLWINRESEKSTWELSRLELGVESEQNRRLILKS